MNVFMLAVVLGFLIHPFVIEPWRRTGASRKPRLSPRASLRLKRAIGLLLIVPVLFLALAPWLDEVITATYPVLFMAFYPLVRLATSEHLTMFLLGIVFGGALYAAINRTKGGVPAEKMLVLGPLQIPAPGPAWFVVGATALLAMVASGMIPYVKTEFGEVHFREVLREGDRQLVAEFREPEFKLRNTLVLGSLEKAVERSFQEADDLQTHPELVDYGATVEARCFYYQFMFPLVRLVDVAITERNLDPYEISSVTRPIATELRHMVLEPERWNDDGAHDRFTERFGELYAKLLAITGPVEAPLLNRGLPDDAHDCVGPPGEGAKAWPSVVKGRFSSLVRAPITHLALTSLLWFNDSTDNAIMILEYLVADEALPGDRQRAQYANTYMNRFIVALPSKVRDRLKRDLAILAKLGRIEYYTGKAPERSYLVATHYRAVLPERLAAARALGKTRSVDRYEEYERDMKCNIAYHLAQTGKSEEMAKSLISDVWQANPGAPEAMDTYAYVRMAFAARANPPRFDEIREARNMFEGALAISSMRPSDIRNDGERILVENHLKQANALLAKSQSF